ncbi:hypothetical protein J23TS9_38020 [Paenibacillus sp. J23TS9]|uniref:GNAT family N-acetyltransferase n=1 Tax=Paenibacillus sp. J23TS9 TaxID=2807193 RepID=UPI001AFEFB6C|nr:GNAT family N-acetyltransferase [Paenibacillus sp. J23TS9]GIP28672.1 hypothetical protein J23TS9_38020 [Paenibacillus sp. J23TS9]
MTSSYKKIAFVWNEPKEKIVVPDRCEFKQVILELEDSFKEIISQVVVGSLDREDKKRITPESHHELVEDIFNVDEGYFHYEKNWWELAYYNGKPVGLIQPVVFKGCEKNGLMEGTIHYIGVIPEFRGKGFINDLLLRATRVLQDIGVWRIYADTDVENFPMRHAFEKAGYEINKE